MADALLSDHRSFRPVEPNLEVKEVRVEGIRYILCRNPEQAQRDAARYDGLWVLDTFNRPSCGRSRPGLQVALERGKSLCGHVVLSFLVRTAMERRIFEEAGLEATFDEILDALARVQQVRVDVKGIFIELTTEPPPLAQAIFRALGIRPPPRLRTLG